MSCALVRMRLLPFSGYKIPSPCFKLIASSKARSTHAYDYYEKIVVTVIEHISLSLCVKVRVAIIQISRKGL